MSRASRGLKSKKAKYNGGNFPADQPPGFPRGIHVRGRECHCGGCSGGTTTAESGALRR